MTFSSCFFSSQLHVSLRVECSRSRSNMSSNKLICQRQVPPSRSNSIEIFGQQSIGWSILRGSRIICSPLGSHITCRKSSALYASWLPCSEIANGAFTLGTVAVLPCYTSMVVAPRSEFTNKLVGSSFPYMVLGALYAYLLYLSWTPDTMRLMFASKYWLPELPGIAKMFSSEMTLASAWIHLLAVDLYAASQVYNDGLQNNVETRHSVSLCLLFCPIGILAHFVTKALARSIRAKEDEVQ